MLKWLLLVDILLILRDLLTNRREALLLSGAGRLYEPKLRRLLGEVEAVPGASEEAGRTLASELGQTDRDHDGFAAAIWHLTEAYRRLPRLIATVREAAARSRAAFVPSLAETRKTFADEAAAAIRRRPSLAERADDLELIPVVNEAGERVTLAAWVNAYLEAGERLSALLSQRSTAEAEPGNEPASLLRTKVIDVLGNLRAALADELEENPELPRDLQSRIFAYCDELAARRVANRAAAATTASTEATTPTGEAPAATEPTLTVE